MVMTMNKKIPGALVKLSIALAALILLTVCVSVSAFADELDPYPVVGGSQDSETIDYQAIGTAITWEGTTYIATDSLPADEAIYVYWDEDGNVYTMEPCGNPFGNDDGLLWFIPSGSVDSVSVVQASLGETYTLCFYDLEWYLENGAITFGAYEECGYVYRVGQCSVGGDVLDGFFPWLIVDGDGYVVGYVAYLDTEEGVIDAYAFEEPAGGSSAGETGGGTNGGGTSSGGTAEEESDPFTKIWFIVAGVVVAGLVVVIVIMSARKKPSPNSEQNPVPAPAPTPVPETVPAPEPVPVPIPAAEPILQPNPAPEWFIQIDGGVMNGFIYPVRNGMLIGRAPECEVHYPENTAGISRRHCKFIIKDEGIFVMDLGSTSGTFLRGVGQLPQNIPQSIRQNDIIYLGEKKNAVVIRCGQ